MNFKPLSEIKDIESQEVLLKWTCPVQKTTKFKQYWFNSLAGLLVEWPRNNCLTYEQFLKGIEDARFVTLVEADADEYKTEEKRDIQLEIKVLTKSNFQKVGNWLEDAGQTTEHFNAQVACDVEEMGEYLEALGDAMDFPHQSDIGLLFSIATGTMKLISTYIRNLNGVGLFNKLMEAPPHKKTKLLDAICDREVTANGVAYMLNFRKDYADHLVQRSNDSKLVVVNGKRQANRDASGKIQKPPTFVPVNLDECV